jgi:hypothetical protein
MVGTGEKTEVALERLVDVLGLTIGLGMVASALFLNEVKALPFIDI